MAYGFTPKYVEQISLDGLTPQQFMALCIETAERLQWNIRYKSNAGLIAYTGKSLFRFSFKVTVIIEEGLATLKSECTEEKEYFYKSLKVHLQKYDIPEPLIIKWPISK